MSLKNVTRRCIAKDEVYCTGCEHGFVSFCYLVLAEEYVSEGFCFLMTLQYEVPSYFCQNQPFCSDLNDVLVAGYYLGE